MANPDGLSQDDVDRAVSFLRSHSAEQIPHVGGMLLPHLEGTCELLRTWGDSAELCLAGLCHTAYGTDGFPHPFVAPTERASLESVIGAEAERIVYFYGSCDRAFLYPRLVNGETGTQYRDRFTGTVFEPEPSLYRAFLEVTFANELEIFRRTPRIPWRVKRHWRAIFAPCWGLVSDAAFASYVETLGVRPSNA